MQEITWHLKKTSGEKTPQGANREDVGARNRQTYTLRVTRISTHEKQIMEA